MGRTVHKVLVLLDLGEKGWGGNQLSVENEFMAHRQEMFPHLLDAEGSRKGQRRMLVEKGLTLSLFLRAELAEWKSCTPLGRKSTGCPAL